MKLKQLEEENEEEIKNNKTPVKLLWNFWKWNIGALKTNGQRNEVKIKTMWSQQNNYGTFMKKKPSSAPKNIKAIDKMHTMRTDETERDAKCACI